MLNETVSGVYETVRIFAGSSFGVKVSGPERVVSAGVVVAAVVASVGGAVTASGVVVTAIAVVVSVTGAVVVTGVVVTAVVVVTVEAVVFGVVVTAVAAVLAGSVMGGSASVITDVSVAEAGGTGSVCCSPLPVQAVKSKAIISFVKYGIIYIVPHFKKLFNLNYVNFPNL